MLLNIHLDCLVLEGVYCTTGEVPVFHPERAPTAEQLHTLLNQIIKRVMKLLTGHGVSYQIGRVKFPESSRAVTLGCSIKNIVYST